MIALVAFVLIDIWPHTAGMAIAFFLPLAIVGCAAGFYVIAICDVPMYIKRYYEGRANGSNKFLTLREGIIDSRTRMVATGSWNVWKHEVGWMTPYFSLGVWLSISMVWMSGHEFLTCFDQ